MISVLLASVMELLRNLPVAVLGICFCIILPTCVQDASGSTSDETINIRIVVDSAELERRHPNSQNVSQNPLAPTAIDPSLAYMIAPRPFVKSGLACHDIVIQCYPKDIIRWFGSTESSNWDSAIIIYNISNLGSILTEPQLTLFNDTIIGPANIDIAKTVYGYENNISLQATVVQSGKVDYKVYFGFYKRIRGEGQKLIGYFSWNPRISIETP